VTAWITSSMSYGGFGGAGTRRSSASFSRSGESLAAERGGPSMLLPEDERRRLEPRARRAERSTFPSST